MKIDGFSFAAVEAGVRYKDRLDIGLIYSESPCVTAGVFTTSLVKAAPVVIDIDRLKSDQAQAILVNSGCANACTGEEGMQAAYRTSALISEALDVDDTLVLLSSTGVIGEQLNLSAFEDNATALAKALQPEGFTQVADAILTTDTARKVAETQIELGGQKVKILGMAKGAGMIMPNMATMLSFIFTDANIEASALNKVLRLANERTFNRITVDGDTSTNDMVMVMANGLAGNGTISDENPSGDLNLFRQGLENVLKNLALQIVSDGEGASKTITIKVYGASTNEVAETIGRTVATSSLVKTAFFGEDANWGRILAAMGRAGVVFDPEKVDIYFGEIKLVDQGLGLDKKTEQAATAVLKEKSFEVGIDMNQGNGSAELYTCDFSIDYVKINSDYRS